MPNIPIPMSTQPNNKTCSFSGELNFCSNFYYAEILYKGQKFKTAEHAYQWSKCKHDADKAAICEAKTPVEAKKIGKKATIIDNWDNSRIPIMYEILKCKFSLPFLKEKLINTGDQELVNENYWRDTVFGVYNKEGDNWLGRLLMRIRDELKDANIQNNQ